MPFCEADSLASLLLFFFFYQKLTKYDLLAKKNLLTDFDVNKLKKKTKKTNHLYSVMMTKNLADFVI